MLKDQNKYVCLEKYIAHKHSSVFLLDPFGWRLAYSLHSLYFGFLDKKLEIQIRKVTCGRENSLLTWSLVSLKLYYNPGSVILLFL